MGWAGKCPNCGEWGSLVETSLGSETPSGKAKSGGGRPGKTQRIDTSPKKTGKRITTKISELDRVLGGGLVGGQVVLIAGEPGIVPGTDWAKRPKVGCK